MTDRLRFVDKGWCLLMLGSVLSIDGLMVRLILKVLSSQGTCLPNFSFYQAL